MLRFRIQSTPNPLARKYVLNMLVKAEGKVSYRSREECAHVPLAERLLQMPAVTQVHFFENVLTVTQDGKFAWDRLDQEIQTVITDLIETHDVNFIDSVAVKERKVLSPELEAINEILDRTIRPGLQLDGGDLELLELEGHVLSVRYLGACGGCPSSMLGTLDAIKHILRDEYDEQLEVVAV